MSPGKFKGFSKLTLDFFSGLKEHNDTAWFREHHDLYEEHVLSPARAFVEAMEDSLQELSPRIIADPRINRSIFKIFRDIRFSSNKLPFKTHLGIWFWEGDGPRMECPGYYFHLEEKKMLIAAGLHVFSPHLLEEFRASAVHRKYGSELKAAASTVEGRGYTIGEKHYKRVPRGFDGSHPNAGFLLFNGLDAWREMEPPGELHSEKLIPFCLESFKDMKPLNDWLLPMTERARARNPELYRDDDLPIY